MSAFASFNTFLEAKAQVGCRQGIKLTWIPDWLFDFQAYLVDWGLWTGRAAIFADCGLGKTPMELVWAENIVRHTGGNVLIGAPLAVSHQIVREAEKFGIRARRSMDGTARKGITVTNYDRLHYFSPADFTGFVGDESSILKSFDGVLRGHITAFMRKLPYRLLGTATAAPNDYTELGTTSEALGYLGHVDMLNRFFTNKRKNIGLGRTRGEQAEWRFKGHAERAFYRWASSYSRALRKPSDAGFDDRRFILPPLTETEHIVEARTLAEGCLFPMPAVGLEEQRQERRRTIPERCEKVAELVNGTGRPAFIGCQLNDEGDLLERLIPDAVQVHGRQSDEEKEARLLAFARGEERVLVTKDKIGAWGLNYQHCPHVVRFASHSYEAYYQFLRRCWRFGQENPVQADIVASEGERGILANMQRKSAQADAMFTNLVAEMNTELHIDRSHTFPLVEEVPAWLC
ncbi:MAG TPA: DEAD/DEAH box helicase [Capsulimonadaceae bacterium]|nr:DEAD/DEAH box helicase [Capsulimonadaceae bacterium]